MKAIFKSLVGNTIIFAIGNGVSVILAFAMVPFYTKMLSPSDFGTSDIITTTVAMLVPLASLNIFAAVFRYALDNHDQQKVFTNSLLVSSVGAGVALSVSAICQLFQIPFALFTGVYIAITIFMTLTQNFVRGINHVKSFAISGVIATITNILSNLVLMWVFKLGLHGYLYSLVISATVTLVYLVFANRLHQYFKIDKVSRAYTKELLTFAMPMIPNSFAWWLTNDANKLIILMFLGPGANGILAVANKIPNMVSTLFGMFANAWQISAVKTNGDDDANASKVYSTTFNSVFGLLLVGCGFIVLIIKWFMNFYVGEHFYQAWTLVPILLLTAVFSNASAFLGTTYLVAKKTNGLITTTVWGMLINTVLCLLLVPIIGLNGAGLAGAIGFLCVSALRFKQTQQFVPFNIDFKQFSGLLVAYVGLSVSVATAHVALAIICFVGMCAIFGNAIMKTIASHRKN